MPTIGSVAVMRNKDGDIAATLYGAGLNFATLQDVTGSFDEEEEYELIADLPLRVSDGQNKLWDVLSAINAMGDTDTSIDIFLSDILGAVFAAGYTAGRSAKD